MVNDRLISFDKVFEMVMNHSLNLTRPPNFIKFPPKNPTTTTTTTTSPGDDDKRRGGGKKRKRKARRKRLLRSTRPRR